MQNEIIKKCPKCGHDFTVEDILHNPDIIPVGMLYNDSQKTACYLFQHEIDYCHSSFAVDIELLRTEIREPIPAETETLSECCEGHCIKINDLAECRQECYYAPFRRLLLRMMELKNIPLPERTFKS